MYQSAALAFISGAIAATLTNPLDLVKLRMQIQRVENVPGEKLSKGRFGYRNIFHGISKMTREEGLISHTRSLSARILYIGLQSLINISLLEIVRQRVMDLIEDPPERI